jgi:hypothetical protein
MYQFYRHTKKPAFVLIMPKDAAMPREARVEEWKAARVSDQIFDVAKKSIEEKGYFIIKVGVTFQEVEATALSE